MRVALFFDGKSFYSGWRDNTGGVRLDFEELGSWLVETVEGERLWGAYYYTGVEVGELAEDNGQQKLMGFLDMLDHQPGFFVQRFPRRVRVTHCPSCKSEFQYTQEKAVDTTMVADMLRLAAVDAFDVAVLISGDADHTPAVEGVRALGKQVYLASWGGYGLSPQLRRVAFDHIDLTEGLLRFGDESEEAEDRSWTSPPEELMIHELLRAEKYFEGGYVGASYFLSRWESPLLQISYEERRSLLDLLLSEGKVEVYESESGAKALRTTQELVPQSS